MSHWIETELRKRGFLGTAAPLYADLALLLEIAMGVALIVGMFLARTGRYRFHAWCQTVVVLLNLSIIALVMTPSFRIAVAPAIPRHLDNPYYALSTAHAVLGTLAELGGLYILIAAGTKILPRRLRLTQYKLWMRSLLVLWWIVLSLGFATYIRWYAP